MVSCKFDGRITETLMHLLKKLETKLSRSSLKSTVLYKPLLVTIIITILTQRSSYYYKAISKCIFLLATIAAIIAYFHLLFS